LVVRDAVRQGIARTRRIETGCTHGFKDRAVANEFCEPGTTGYPKWTTVDAMSWKLAPEWAGGGAPRLFAYKDGWIKYNAKTIKAAAARHNIPPILLASVAWAEAGGMPDFVDDVAFSVRSFDWSGPDWIDKHLTITSTPAKTSFGSVSMQLRVAARELGVDPETLSYSRQHDLAVCLETDVFNLEIVARHLHGLILFDYPKADTLNLTDEQFVIVGSRYNRGTSRKLADFVASLAAKPDSPLREYTSYGRRMLQHRDRVQHLLGVVP